MKWLGYALIAGAVYLLLQRSKIVAAPPIATAYIPPGMRRQAVVHVPFSASCPSGYSDRNFMGVKEEPLLSKSDKLCYVATFV